MNFLRRKSTKNIECCIKNKVLNLEMNVNASSLSLSRLDPYKKIDSPNFRASPNIWLLGVFPYRKSYRFLVQNVTDGRQKVSVQSVKFHLVC